MSEKCREQTSGPPVARHVGVAAIKPLIDGIVDWII